MVEQPDPEGTAEVPIQEAWPGGPKFRFFGHMTDDDRRQIGNQMFKMHLNTMAFASELLAAKQKFLESLRNPPRDLPQVTSSEWSDYTKVVDRVKDPEDPLKAGLVSDHPITAVQLGRLTGSKSRNNFHALIRKGLLHSYGKKKGAVPAWIRDSIRPNGRAEWFSLTTLQRRIVHLPELIAVPDV